MKAGGLGFLSLFFFLRPEWAVMLTAEKQVSQVLGCSITQARYSQPYLTSFLWHPPAYWDICTLNPSAFSNAWQTHCGQDGCDTSVPAYKHLLDLKVSACWIISDLWSHLSLSFSYLPKRIKASWTFGRTVWQVPTETLCEDR